MSIDRNQAWEVLINSAKQYAANPDKYFGSALSKAAKEWAEANGYTSIVGRAAAAPAADSGMLLPNYGRSKGQPVKGASRQDLEFYANGCRRSLADPAKSRWHDKERQLLAAIEAELALDDGDDQDDDNQPPPSDAPF